MTKTMMIRFATAVASFIAVPAHADPVGYAACMAKSQPIAKIFYALPVPADQAKTEALARQYAQMLRDEHYAANDMYAPKDAPPPPLEVDCRWNATSAGAKEWTDQVVKGAEGRGFATVGTSFTPK